MYVIKHHNKFQSDMPSHIREMVKESYLNIFCSTQIWSGRRHRRRRMSDRNSSLGLKSRRANKARNQEKVLLIYNFLPIVNKNNVAKMQCLFGFYVAFNISGHVGTVPTCNRGPNESFLQCCHTGKSNFGHET